MSIISCQEALEMLLNNDNITILTHKNPDGDTLGCGFALMNFLRSIGKKVNVANHHTFPKRYDFLYENYEKQDFEEEFVVAVDIADLQLLSDELSEYKAERKIDLCIDHHCSNSFFAKKTVLDVVASAACEVVFEIIKLYGERFSDIVAKCLYTGIATDTGCFRFENTTARTHIIASELMQYNIDCYNVNRLMFDIKSKGRILVEKAVIDTMEFHFDDRLAIITVTNELVEKTGIDSAEFDGLASIALQPEGVEIGIFIKETKLPEQAFKLSVRTTKNIDASQFCKQFGGGGHIRAAGCQITGSLEKVKTMVINAVRETL